ncbi:MAG: DNA polymerase III subunit alpha [Gammaproteobacteria bacterium]
MPNLSFVHLNVHTEFSLVDGLIDVKQLMKTLSEQKMPAVAITDHNNLFALVKFYRAALQAGIKPLVGAALTVQDPADRNKFFRLLLFCQNQTGYRNLTRLMTRAYLEGQTSKHPRIEKNWLKEYSEGLIALSGAGEGDIGQAIIAQHFSLAEQLLQEWQTVFPKRFYLELQRVGHSHEAVYIAGALKLASSYQVPVVATNAVRFLSKEDFEAHEARVCIHGGWTLNDEKRQKNYTDQQYLRSAAEMEALFADIPAALINTVEIAKRCNLELTLGKSFLPSFPVPNHLTVDDFFKQSTQAGLADRLKQQTVESAAVYQQRLDLEVKVIQEMGFTGYFLIVADFIRWAKSQAIFVGPGRGSGAGSLVAYALGITDIDPLQHDLLFERFLNPERISMPDFDIDFCMEGRDKVIDYVMQKYGREKVAQIITYGTMAARAVVRDVGRVLGHPYGFVDKIAKLIPFELGMTLQKALLDEPLLMQRYQQEEEIKILIDLAIKLEGVPRNVGKHAGGLVIGSSDLTDFTPLYCEPGGENRITQFDKDDVEAVGLVKFDFLGLRTLTIMDWALQTINAKRASHNEPAIDINTIPLDDPTTYTLFKACQTTAVFQFESRVYKDLLRKLAPDHFEDIVALQALGRPGPLGSGMVDDFLNRKHGRSKVIYPHPLLEPILRPTYGIILYQEQVMQIAQVLAGYTLGGADILRRAMGKKKNEEMARQRAIFVEGAEKNGVKAHTANDIFSLMEKFADYGFNKSHSAAYALLSYQTAWLKAHYPAEYMAAVLSSDMDHTEKVVKILRDCAAIGLKILPPSINTSQYRFTVNTAGEIVYGLGAIKGVGSAALDSILLTRKQQGSFTDLFSFCQRVETRKVNRKVLEALICAGALDDFQQERSVLMASLDIALQAAEQHSRHKGQSDLFSDLLDDHTAVQTTLYVKAPAWSESQRLLSEKETLGWYVSGHPIARYTKELACFIDATIHALRPTVTARTEGRPQSRNATVLTAGYVTALRVMQTKSGGRMASLLLEDQTGQIDTIIFPQLFDTYRHLLVKDQLLVIEGEVSVDELTESYKLAAREIYSLDEARKKFAKNVQITIAQSQMNVQWLAQFESLLQQHAGDQCLIFAKCETLEASAHLNLSEKWRVHPTESLLEGLKGLCLSAEFNY